MAPVAMMQNITRVHYPKSTVTKQKVQFRLHNPVLENLRCTDATGAACEHSLMDRVQTRPGAAHPPLYLWNVRQHEVGSDTLHTSTIAPSPTTRCSASGTPKKSVQHLKAARCMWIQPRLQPAEPSHKPWPSP